MNQDRTFGIEIECFAKISREDMRDRMLDFFVRSGLAHQVIVAGYGHMTNAHNTTRWQIESDGSLRHSDSNMRNNYPYSMEIKTPVLKGTEGLKALKVVCDALDGYATVNRSCGLHVHHGLPNETEPMLKNLANSWIENEKHFLGVLPNSRQNNSYASPWRQSSLRPARVDDDFRNWYSQCGLGRRCTMNFQSYWTRKTVEIRMHSGSVEYEKISNWLIATQLYVDKGLKGFFNGSSDFNTFVINMKKDGTITIPAQTRRVVDTGSGDIFKRDAKYTSWPRSNSKKYRIIGCLLREDGATVDEIARTLDDYFGRLAPGKQAKYVAGQLTNMKSKKYGFGFDIAKSRVSNRFKILRESTERTEVTEGTTITFNVSAMQRKAVTWLSNRYNHFEGIRRGGLTI